MNKKVNILFSISLFDDSTKQLNDIQLNEWRFVQKLFIKQHKAMASF